MELIVGDVDEQRASTSLVNPWRKIRWGNVGRTEKEPLTCSSIFVWIYKGRSKEKDIVGSVIRVANLFDQWLVTSEQTRKGETTKPRNGFCLF